MTKLLLLSFINTTFTVEQTITNSKVKLLKVTRNYNGLRLHYVFEISTDLE